MATIELESIWKVYADGTEAVRDLTLTAGDGEFVVLVGPSGCGKTTALRMVAGLEDVSAGTIRIDGKRVNNLPSRDRDVAMVFQNYALYPHLSVAENIGFGLTLRKVDKAEINRRVREAADILGITEYLDRKPRALSGGQRQRVAMGRAIVRQPKAFLMDEPLSNLDAKLRVQMRSEVLRLQKDLGTTTIYVTHDQVEAMTMGDRVAVMRRGILQQVASPQELYDSPVNLFVAGFIGSPAMNLVEASLERRGGDLVARFTGAEIVLPAELVARRRRVAERAGGTVILGIRPEDLDDVDVAGVPPEASLLTVEAELVEKLGAEALIHFTLDTPPVLTSDTSDLALDTAPLDRSRAGFVARVSPRSKAEKGSTVTLAVDVSRLHVFDPETGVALGGPGLDTDRAAVG